MSIILSVHDDNLIASRQPGANVVTKPVRVEQTESLYEQARSDLENLIRSGKRQATEAVIEALPV